MPVSMEFDIAIERLKRLEDRVLRLESQLKESVKKKIEVEKPTVEEFKVGDKVVLTKPLTGVDIRVYKERDTYYASVEESPEREFLGDFTADFPEDFTKEENAMSVNKIFSKDEIEVTDVGKPVYSPELQSPVFVITALIPIEYLKKVGEEE
jgi:hypothetical protein